MEPARSLSDSRTHPSRLGAISSGKGVAAARAVPAPTGRGSPEADCNEAAAQDNGRNSGAHFENVGQRTGRRRRDSSIPARGASDSTRDAKRQRDVTDGDIDLEVSA